MKFLKENRNHRELCNEILNCRKNDRPSVGRSDYLCKTLRKWVAKDCKILIGLALTCLTVQSWAEDFYVKDGCSIKNIVIPNNSFEKEIATTGGENPVQGEWYFVHNHGQYVKDPAIAHGGNGCIKISGMKEATESDYIWTLISVKPKTFYRIRSWVKTENVKTHAYIFAFEMDGNKKVVANSRTDFIVGTQEWKEAEFCIQTAAGAATMGIRLVLDGEGTAYFDDVDVQEIKTIDGQLPNTSFEMAQTPKNPLFWWFSTQPDSGSVGVYVNDKKVAHTGNCCVKLENIKEKFSGSWIPTTVVVRPDTAYDVSCWIKTSKFVEKKGAWLWIFGYEKGKKEPQGLLGGSMEMISNAPDWQQVKLKIITGKTMESLTIWPRVDGVGAAWFDDITMKETPEDEL
jgi:hypothetical protein